MITLHYATIADNIIGGDIPQFEFSFPANLEMFIHEQYKDKGKKCVLIAMIGEESHNYFISADWKKVCEYIIEQVSYDKNNVCFLFEEPTYEEAFAYCKDAAEGHELGLN